MQPWKQQEKRKTFRHSVRKKMFSTNDNDVFTHNRNSKRPICDAKWSGSSFTHERRYFFFYFTTFFKRNRRRRQPIGRTCILHSLALQSLMARRTELIIHNRKNPEPRASQHRCALFDQRHWNIRRRSKKKKRISIGAIEYT